MAVRSGTRRTRSSAKAATTLTQGKLTIGMTDYDPEADRAYAGEQPVAGNYTFKLTDVSYHENSEGKPSIKWRFMIYDKKSPFDGWPFGERYTNLDPDGALKQTQAILYALTGSTAAVDLDLSDTAAGDKWRTKFIEGAALVRGSIKMEPYQDEMRPKLNRVMPMTAIAESEDDEDDFEDADEYVDEEDEDEGDLEDEDEEDDDEEEDDEEDEEDDEELEDDEEEEEEPEPEPAPRRRAAAKSTARKAAAPATRAAKKAAPARRARR